mgnify:FL=1
MTKDFNLPKLSSQNVSPEKHNEICRIFENLRTTIKNRSNIKEHTFAVKKMWEQFFQITNNDRAMEEELEKNASDRVLLENAMLRTLLIYCFFTEVKYEKLLKDDELEIFLNVPFMKHLLLLKTENYGAQILKENFGLELVDWNENGLFVKMPENNDERPN